MRALLDTLFATQNGLDPVSAMPHGLTSRLSCNSASPATSDTKFVCRYAWPAGIAGAGGGIAPLSSTMVNVAVLGAASPAPVGLLSTRLNVSSPSTIASLVTATTKLLLVSPGPKVSVPGASVKSLAPA